VLDHPKVAILAGCGSMFTGYRIAYSSDAAINQLLCSLKSAPELGVPIAYDLTDEIGRERDVIQ